MKQKIRISFLALLSITVLLLTPIIFDSSAFAISAGTEFSSPTQQNAYASYNTDTNDVQISWNFNTLPTDTVCLLKGDVRYNENLGGTGSEDYTSSFTPLYYSPLTATPVAIQDSALLDAYAEEVSCTGDMRIDIATIMNHSENIHNYPDMQLFLTFYKSLANGDFNAYDSNRIDEVFVMYSSIHTFDKATQDYGCGGQIGSTLYIDQSGIHGNNGDNCEGAEFEYFVLESNQYVDVVMDGATAPLLVDINSPDYGYHTASFYTLLIEVGSKTITVTEQKNGSGCDGDCTHPTFYMDESNTIQIVKNGWSWNGNYTNVVGLHVPWDKIIVNTGELNTFSFKAYENGGTAGFDMFQIAFGIAEIYDSINSGEVLLEIYMNGDTLDYLNVIDEENLLMFSSIEANIVECGYVESECIEISGTVVFRETLKYDKIMIEAIDDSRNVVKSYINDGVNAEGESMNVPPTHELFNKSSNQQVDDLWKTLVRTDRINDVWIDKNNILYQKISENDFERITPMEYFFQCNDKSLDTVMNQKRINCNYNSYKAEQAIIGLEIMKTLCPSCLDVSFADFDDSFSFDHPLDYINKLENPELIEMMRFEEDRALQSWLDENH